MKSADAVRLEQTFKPFCLQKQIYYWKNNHLVLNLRTPSTSTTWTPRTKRGRHLRTSCPKAGATPPSEMCVCVPPSSPYSGVSASRLRAQSKASRLAPSQTSEFPVYSYFSSFSSFFVSHFSPLLSFVMSVQLFPLHCPLSSWLSLLPLCRLSIFPYCGSFFFLPDSFFYPSVHLKCLATSFNFQSFNQDFSPPLSLWYSHSFCSLNSISSHPFLLFLSLSLSRSAFYFFSSFFVLFLKHVSYLAAPLFNFLAGFFLIIICLSAALHSIRSWSPQWTQCAIITWSRLWCPLSTLYS